MTTKKELRRRATERARRWRRENPEKLREANVRYWEKHRERLKVDKLRYARENREAVNVYQRKWRAENPEAVREMRRRAGPRWRQANGEKTRAHRTVRTAVANGTLTRPTHCSKCGVSPKVRNSRSGLEAHHHNYTKPLDVEWLCIPCHRKEHACPTTTASSS